MDHINQTGNRSVNFAFTQSIGNYSADQLNNMDISDLMTLVMTRMLDAKEVQFKQKLEEADARTKRLEGFGDQMKSLARIKAEFGADDKDDTAIKDSKGAKEKVSADQWDESSADYQFDELEKTQSTGTYASYDQLSDTGKSEAWSRVEDELEVTLTDAEKIYLREIWVNNAHNEGVGGYKTGDPVMDAKIKAKFDAAWHKQGYASPPKDLPWSEQQNIYSYNQSDWNKKAEQMFGAYWASGNVEPLDDKKDVNANYSYESNISWKDNLSDEGKQLISNVDVFCQTGLANGTLTESDVKNIKSGNFKKSDIEALEVSIKNEQDKINSINTRDQIDIQKITNQIDQLNNLISTLTKKFNEASTSVINRM